jgi:hypothetical protein
MMFLTTLLLNATLLTTAAGVIDGATTVRSGVRVRKTRTGRVLFEIPAPGEQLNTTGSIPIELFRPTEPVFSPPPPDTDTFFYAAADDDDSINDDGQDDKPNTFEWLRVFDAVLALLHSMTKPEQHAFRTALRRHREINQEQQERAANDATSHPQAETPPHKEEQQAAPPEEEQQAAPVVALQAPAVIADAMITDEGQQGQEEQQVGTVGVSEDVVEDDKTRTEGLMDKPPLWWADACYDDTDLLMDTVVSMTKLHEQKIHSQGHVNTAELSNDEAGMLTVSEFERSLFVKKNNDEDKPRTDEPRMDKPRLWWADACYDDTELLMDTVVSMTKLYEHKLYSQGHVNTAESSNDESGMLTVSEFERSLFAKKNNYDDDQGSNVSTAELSIESTGMLTAEELERKLFATINDEDQGSNVSTAELSIESTGMLTAEELERKRFATINDEATQLVGVVIKAMDRDCRDDRETDPDANVPPRTRESLTWFQARREQWKNSPRKKVKPLPPPHDYDAMGASSDMSISDEGQKHVSTAESSNIVESSNIGVYEEESGFQSAEEFWIERDLAAMT